MVSLVTGGEVGVITDGTEATFFFSPGNGGGISTVIRTGIGLAAAEFTFPLTTRFPSESVYKLFDKACPSGFTILDDAND